jgi:hypothetical protein
MKRESASCTETKEFCGAAWVFQNIEKKGTESLVPLIALRKSIWDKVYFSKEFLQPAGRKFSRLA